MKILNFLEKVPLNDRHLEGWALAVDGLAVAAIVKLAETASAGGPDAHLQMALAFCLVVLAAISYTFRGFAKQLVQHEVLAMRASLQQNFGIHVEAIAQKTEDIRQHVAAYRLREQEGGTHA